MRMKLSGEWEPNGCTSPPELSEPIPLNTNRENLDGIKIKGNKNGYSKQHI